MIEIFISQCGRQSDKKGYQNLERGKYYLGTRVNDSRDKVKYYDPKGKDWMVFVRPAGCLFRSGGMQESSFFQSTGGRWFVPLRVYYVQNKKMLRKVTELLQDVGDINLETLYDDVIKPAGGSTVAYKQIQK